MTLLFFNIGNSLVGSCHRGPYLFVLYYCLFLYLFTLNKTPKRKTLGNFLTVIRALLLFILVYILVLNSRVLTTHQKINSPKTSYLVINLNPSWTAHRLSTPQLPVLLLLQPTVMAQLPLLHPLEKAMEMTVYPHLCLKFIMFWMARYLK